MSQLFRLAPANHRRCLVAATLAVACALPLGAGARELSNFDALSRAPVSAASTPSARALATAAPTVHLEPRLGVPTFVWGHEVDAAFASLARTPLARKTAITDDGERARGFLRDMAEIYRMTPAEVDALALTQVARLPDGGSLARFRHDVDSIEVWREQVNVLVDKRGTLVAVGGFALGAPATRAGASDASRVQAVALALSEQGFARSAVDSLVRMREEAGYQWLTLPDGTTGTDGATLAAPMRVKRVWYRLPDALVPAWYVEIQVSDKTSAHGTDAYSYVVSATDGALLFRNSLVTDAAFTYRVYAETTAPFLPLPGPGARGGFPHPTGQPDGYQPAVQPRNLVTLQNAPFSRNDPWLNDIANRTQGNNVEAFTNMLAPDGFGTPGVEECNLNLPVDGDLHACVTSTSTFDHTYDHNLPPNANRSQVAAVVTNLFYTINYLHDFFYDAGFDEVAGNAQGNNFNRGGVANDSIFAEAQDYTGTNNASMFTAARWPAAAHAHVPVELHDLARQGQRAGIDRRREAVEHGRIRSPGLRPHRHGGPGARCRQRRRPHHHRRVHAVNQRSGRGRQDRAGRPRHVHVRGEGQERAGCGCRRHAACEQRHARCTGHGGHRSHPHPGAVDHARRRRCHQGQAGRRRDDPPGPAIGAGARRLARQHGGGA